jgi:ubiquinone/menaquinone biosynthesis C-methylase UbiE
MEKEAFKFSGEDAVNYDHYLGPILFEPYAIDLVSKIDTSLITAVLEIACGTGRVTRHLRDRFDNAVTITATDISADMIAVAEGKVTNGPVKFKVEDAQQLSFADNTFDLVVCQFGLMFLPDKKKGLCEALRVLKPGGTFMFVTWDSTLNIPIMKLMFNDMVINYFKDEDPARFLVPFSLADPSILKSWMEEAGFKDVQTSRVVLTSGAPSAKAIVDALFLKHPLGSAVASKDPAAVVPMAREMEQQITKQFGATDIDLQLAAFLVVGKKV